MSQSRRRVARSIGTTLLVLKLAACSYDPAQQAAVEPAFRLSTTTMQGSPTAKNDSATHESTRVSPSLLVNQNSLNHASDQVLYAFSTEAQSETYANQLPNKTFRTLDEPVSTFSIDVDTGSYANVRRYLNSGQLPPQNAVRVEELINYFDYSYPNPSNVDMPVSVNTVLGKTPWNDSTHLLQVGLKGFTPQDQELPPANLVFLIDVSGSMRQTNKLELLKTAISLLVKQLDEQDKVSIVVYAGSTGTVLDTTPGNQHRTIIHSLATLEAGGSTNGAQGIQLAYQTARQAYIPNGINRVILATDGDFNVGVTNVDQLKHMIEQQRLDGIELTTLGVGTGNYNDHLMEQLANTGNGNYAYLDTIAEAQKVLVDQLKANLWTIAKDVKVQVEFNPNVVSEYRLIGYNNRLLSEEDFNNDKVDAGEIGAGHTVTALYELSLKGSQRQRYSPRRYSGQIDDVEYDTQLTNIARFPNEVGEVRLRFKLPKSKKSQVVSSIVELNNFNPQTINQMPDTLSFASSVALFGQLLAGDTRVGNSNFDDVLQLAERALGENSNGYRSEYLTLVKLANSLHQLKSASMTTH